MGIALSSQSTFPVFSMSCNVTFLRSLSCLYLSHSAVVTAVDPSWLENWTGS